MDRRRTVLGLFLVAVFSTAPLLAVAAESNAPPFIDPVADMVAIEGQTATQTIHASDPDGDPIQFQKVSGPPFMTVTTTDPQAGVGAIVLTPGYADVGTAIQASVRAGDGVLAGNARPFLINVIHVNRSPQAVPGGPYFGIAGVPIVFDGSQSVDPDGDALGFTWSFGDLSTAEGSNPSHAYGADGTYMVELTVTDGLLTGNASTTATITQFFPARAFTTPENRVLRIKFGRPSWAIEIEPIARSFVIGDIDPATVRMRSDGTGSVSQVFAIAGKIPVLDDADRNGIKDLLSTFSSHDLGALFANIRGTASVPVTIEGDLLSGGTFRAQTSLQVIKSGGRQNASVYPNPMNPTGRVGFVTMKPGHLRAELFDAGGRLVRVLANRELSAAGLHYIDVDGRTGAGTPLASGLYYIRLETPDGTVTRRAAVLK